MNSEQLLLQILTDIRVELTEQFKENFRRKAFFDQPWIASSNPSRTLLRTGNLMRSIRGDVSENRVTFSSSMAYAYIHNHGGSITVTQKMKNYFWRLYIEAQKSQSRETGFYKAMALKPLGSKITIPKRQFIGDHPQVQQAVNTIIKKNTIDYLNNLKKQLSND